MASGSWGLDKELWRQGVRDTWNRAMQGIAEPVLLARLDAFTQDLEPLIPLTWWTDPENWSSDHLYGQGMPLTRQRLQARDRQAESLKDPPAAPTSARRRLRS